jgi:hypothetical protein
MSNDKINYKIVDFNGSYNNLLKVIKKTGDKNKIAKACNLYSKLHRLEIGLKKQIEKIEELLEEDSDNSSNKSISADHTDTENDYSNASVDTKNSIEVRFQ